MRKLAFHLRVWFGLAATLWMPASLIAQPRADYRMQRLGALSFNRAFLCRVERSYLSRRRAGLPGAPGFFFSVEARDIAKVQREERRNPILRSAGFDAEGYLVALMAIATLTDGDEWKNEENPRIRKRLAAISSFLYRNRDEIVTVFAGAGDVADARLSSARELSIATAIARHCDVSHSR